MNNKEFNEQRHNRKKQQYRFILGIQQLWNYPLLNLIWGLFAGGVVFLVMAKSKCIAIVEVSCIGIVPWKYGTSIAV